MSMRSTMNSLVEAAAAPAPMFEAVDELALPLVFPATPALEEPVEPLALSFPLAMVPLVPPLLRAAEPLDSCSVPCAFT